VECERSASILRNNVESAILETLLADLSIKECIMCAAVDWKILLRSTGYRCSNIGNRPHSHLVTSAHSQVPSSKR